MIKPIFTSQQIADQLTRGGTYWYGNNGDMTIKYAFSNSFGSWWPSITGETGLNATQKIWVTHALDALEDLFAFNFVEVAQPANTSNSFPTDIMQFTNVAGTGTFSSSYTYGNGDIVANAVVFDSTWSSNQAVNLEYGSYGYMTMLHEILHSVGLEHPGSYDAGSGQSITYQNNAEFAQDTHRFTIMSYFSVYEDGSGANNYDVLTGKFVYPRTPMVYDILAMTSGDFDGNFSGYAANSTTRNTDTTYGYNITPGINSAYDFATYPAPVLTIYDTGGIDTLDLSGDTVANTSTLTYNSNGSVTNVSLAARTNTLIDIREGQYSSTHGMVYNIGIAFGTVIENVVGTQFADTIYGNAADNRLDGGSAGNDIIYAGEGEDYLIGGSGMDQLFGDAGNDYLDGGTGSDTLQGGAGDDTILYDAADNLANVNGGIGFDTLLFEAIWVSIDLAMYGFEQSALLILDMANELWDEIFTYYNLTEDLTTKSTFFDDGTSELVVYDVTDAETWSEWIRVYDVNGNVTSETFVDDVSDVINGTELGEDLFGTAASETINGLGGADVIFAFDGDDTVNGGTGNDYLDGGLGSDQLFGGADNDRIVYDAADSIIEGGAGIDTLIVDGSLPVGFNLVAQGFEFAEQLVHNSNNEQTNRYNSNWQLIGRDYVYANGDTTNIVFDVNNAEAWSRQITYSDISNTKNWAHYTDSYDDQNRIFERSYLYDNGNTTVTLWDLNNQEIWSKSITYGDEVNSRSWSTYTDYYNDANQIVERHYILDNGDTNTTHWDLADTESWTKSITYGDGLHTRSWSTYTDYYNDANQIVERQFLLDNGDSTSTVWDVNDEQPWAYQHRFVDGLGTRSYSEYTKSYDAFNRLTEYETIFDNGDSAQTQYDADNSQTWSRIFTFNDGIGTRNWQSYSETYDDHGRLAEKLFVFDNGNQTLQVWDLDDNEVWYRQDHQYDTSDLYAWSERIFEYDENGVVLNTVVIDDGDF